MKKIILVTILISLMVAGVAGVVFAAGGNVDTSMAPVNKSESMDQDFTADIGINISAKKCSFQSDCEYGKCKGGQCGGCDFQSDCKGWGKCKNGQCGGCDFQSDCKGFGSCSSGQCTKSPY